MIYLLGSTQLSMWWNRVYLNYTTMKGDEYFFFIEYLLYLTLAFYLVQLFLVRQIKYLIIILLPLIFIITSVILGMGIVLILPFEDTFLLTIGVYCTIYVLTNILASWFFIKKMTRTNKKTGA